MGRWQPVWLLVRGLPSPGPLSPILLQDEPVCEISRPHLFILQGEEAQRGQGAGGWSHSSTPSRRSWVSDLYHAALPVETEEPGGGFLFQLPFQRHHLPTPSTPRGLACASWASEAS